MWGGRRDRVASGQRDGGQVLGVAGQSGANLLRGDRENSSGEHLAIVHELDALHFVLERTDLQLVQEGGLRHGNLVAFVDDHDLVHDLNLTLLNLGGNVQSLEETRLFGVHAGGTGRHDNLLGGELASASGHLSHLRVEDSLHFGQVSVGEDHADVARAHVTDHVEVGARFPVGLSLCVVLHVFGGFEEQVLDGSLHVRVLAHQHLRVDGSQALSHDRDLLRGDIVDINEDDLVVFAESLLQVVPAEVLRLGLSSFSHFYSLI